MKKKFPKDVEIFELVEIDDEDWRGATLGYYAVGHHDKQSFAIAVNQSFELVEMDYHIIHLADVEIGYLNQTETEDGYFTINRSKKDHEGSFEATFVFF